MSTTTTTKPAWISRGEALKKIDTLEAELATLKASKAPGAAIARATETAARTTANELATARREAAPGASKAAATTPAATLTAADYLASIAKPTMTRAEFEKIPHGQRGEVIKRVKLVP